MSALLTIRDLHVSFDTEEGVVQAVDGVSLRLDRGEVLGLVGESGCGKSALAMSVPRLLPMPPARIAAAGIALDGTELTTLSPGALRGLRGRRIGVVFQEPMTALSPLHRVGAQIEEAIRLHRRLSRARTRALMLEWLERVGIPNPAQRAQAWPHELSGGMQQRIMIAMALVHDPDLVIADEPTTALDVLLQAQVLELMRRLRREQSGLLLITHDMGVIRQMATRVAVMYAGEIVEEAPAAALFAAPLHPYTQALLAAMPSSSTRGRALRTIPGQVPSALAWPGGCRFRERCPYAAARCGEHPGLQDVGGGRSVRCCVVNAPRATRDAQPAARETRPAVVAGPPLLEVRDLRTWYPVRRGVLARTVDQVRAVDGISLTLRAGETLGVVGASGCGKTTLARTILRLERPRGGAVLVDGQDVLKLRGAALKAYRRAVQVIFQDPFASLNPRHTVLDLVTEGMLAHSLTTPATRRADASRLLVDVGLDAGMLDRYPHAFSGGQRQRIAIARALSLSPRLLICDEAVSALDLSVRAQILNLLAELRDRYGLAYLFITHDLGVVRHLADRIVVMLQGRIVEEGPTVEVLAAPRHDYTRQLLAAVPHAGGKE
ncbi:MAG: dipeptide ABC transporter ATP-binding protein [Kiritimatiellae bacterium]|nr:dipeptide ABC transporter ATP-binding protein [Kiritimatiellia bacterium]